MHTVPDDRSRKVLSLRQIEEFFPLWSADDKQRVRAMLSTTDRLGYVYSTPSSDYLTGATARTG